MQIDENLIFVALIIVFVIFLVNKQPKLNNIDELS